ncbi:MAG: hypothetical protein ACYTF9_10050 [Planctomycetota bacterium]|jgi:hypothetical protein
MRPLSIARVRALRRLRNRFGSEAAVQKDEMLIACSACALTVPRTVLAYHDTLLFIAAHPQSGAQSTRVEAELARIDAAGPRLFRTRDGAYELDMSGLAGGPVEAGFSIPLIEWMLERFPGQVELAWQQGAIGPEFDTLISLAMLASQRDGRLNTRFDMERWLQFVVGSDASPQDSLRWVIERIRDVVPDEELRALVAECVDLRVRWHLQPGDPTRTRARFPDRPLFVQRGASKRRFDTARVIERPLPSPTRLTRARGTGLIDVARAVLAVREREADPVTHASEGAVRLFSLDRGIDVALFGLQPAQRLPLESYVGYVAARNRVPIAYGGAWMLGRRAEIGVHLFESFRGGESGYLFAQLMRTYRQHYGVTRFHVDPYQLGDDNNDAIRSGAFWFYYRLGYRHVDDELRRTAAEEWKDVRADRSHRTPPALLRRFAKSPVALDLQPGHAGEYHADSTRLGVAVTQAVRNRFGSDRSAAERWCMRRVTRLLHVDRSRWTPGERLGFERLCPLVAMLPGLDDWPERDRKALAALMRAKGATSERDFARRLGRHRRLQSAFADLEATVDWAAISARPRRRAVTS